MYRESDRRVFMLLSLGATLAIAASFGSILTYHFFIPSIFYRDFGFVLLIFSGLLKLQMYLHKVLIIERRVTNILQPSQRQSSLGKGTATLGLLLYAGLFWLTLISVIVGYIPMTGWGDYLPF